MTVKIQKWGNSLGVRVPKNLADLLKIQAGSEVILVPEDRGLLLKPIRQRRVSLRALVDQITPQNRHGEIDWGEPVGREVW